MSSSKSSRYINKLQGKRVLVFGATSGIGFAVTEALVEHGAHLIISGSQQSRLDHTIERLQTSYPTLSTSQIDTYACDLSNADTLEAGLEALLKKVTDNGASQLHHVVFTAGDMFSLPPLREFTLEALHSIETVRLIAPLYLAKLLPKYMVDSPDSSITLTGGINTNRPRPGFAVGAVLGAALEGLTRGMAVDLAPLRTNLVVPGAVNTELLRRWPQDARDGFAGKALTKRLGRPEDVAEQYLQCMKDSNTTGSIFISDGGYLLS